MKTFFLGTVGLVALSLSAPASAADLAARPYTKAPPMVAPVYDWSGFYIGANGGWGSARNCWDFLTPAGTFVAPEGCHDSSGGTAGGQIGYRWQTGTFVVGLEAQGNWADLSGSNISTLTGFNNRSRINAFGLFTGQVGYAFNNALFYVKGGAAVTNDRFDVYTSAVGIPANTLIANAGGDQTRWGGTAGVGLEYGFAPNWSAAIEYDHLFMGDRTTNFVTAGPLFAPGVPASTDRIRQDVDLVTVRVNYRWGGPVIAKY